MDAPPPALALNAAQQAFLGKLGTERENIKKLFYLITFSRILLETLAAAGGGLRDAASLRRQQIAAAATRSTTRLRHLVAEAALVRRLGM